MTSSGLQSRRRSPALAADTVVFTIHQGSLQVLLIRRATEPFRDRWALPGGFVEVGESPRAAALRELREETGLTGVCLEQLHTFGEPGRDPRGHVVSVAYYALVPPDHLHPAASDDARETAWFRYAGLPPLAFDHERIAGMARQRLGDRFDYSTIALQFMPEHFTLRALQQVCETIRERPLDKRNFRKRMLATGCILPIGNTMVGRHRPAELYRVRSPGTVGVSG